MTIKLQNDSIQTIEQASECDNISFQQAFAAIKQRITTQQDSRFASKAEQLSLLEQLSAFEFGRSLIRHQRLTRYWRHYILTYSLCQPQYDQLSPLHVEMLNHFPLINAIQQRHRIVLAQLQQRVQNNTRLLSLPCGLMEELAYLEYKHIEQIELVGVDRDDKALEQARGICQARRIYPFTALYNQDPWQLEKLGKFDAISSHSLILYEPNKTKIASFYQQCYNSLNKNGLFITSFLTPPPDLDMECEWDFRYLEAKYLRKQKILFSEVLQTKWQAYQKSVHLRDLLSQAGFQDIQFFYDEAKLFPVVVGQRL